MVFLRHALLVQTASAIIAGQSIYSPRRIISGQSH
jgi:hypothetical protein